MLPLVALLLTQTPVDAGPPADGGLVVDAGADAADAADAGSEPPPFHLGLLGTEQVVVVTTEHWQAQLGQLVRYEKVGARWMQVGAAMEVVVGEEGLGWGLGLHPLGVGEPRKTEGDGRAPAGVFALASAFGRGAPPMKTSMPWLETRPGLACVDDPRSHRYNRLVDTSAEDASTQDWRTAERMQRDDGLYDVGVLVDHNALGDGKKPVIIGRGSCVFLHIWKKKSRATVGCTAMARWDLDKLVEWLDPAKKPVLVQLPREERIKRRHAWGLP